jgi:hypothetical protein
MTLALAIAANAFAVLALVVVLAYVMSRAARLRPHAPATVPAATAVPVFRAIHLARSPRIRGSHATDGGLAVARS